MSGWRHLTVAIGSIALVAVGCTSDDPGGATPSTTTATTSSTIGALSCADDPAFVPVPESADLGRNDSVVVGGEWYTHAEHNDGVLDPASLGDTVTTVCVNLDERDLMLSGPDTVAPDGTSSFLDAGTAVQTIEGSDPSTRVGLRHRGVVRVYERFIDESGDRGDQVIHVADGVAAIRVNSYFNAAAPLAVVDDPAALSTVVEQISNAVVELDPIAAEPRVFLQLDYPDATSTRRAFSLDTGVLAPGLQLSEQWLATATEALLGVEDMGEPVDDRPDAEAAVQELFRALLTTPDLDPSSFQSPESAAAWSTASIADPDAGPVVGRPTITANGVAHADVVLIGQSDISLPVINVYALETAAGWVVADVSVREIVAIGEQWPA